MPYYGVPPYGFISTHTLVGPGSIGFQTITPTSFTVNDKGLASTFTTADPVTVGWVDAEVKALDEAVMFASPEITEAPRFNVNAFELAVILTVVVTVGITLVMSNGSAATTSIILLAEIFTLPIAIVNGFAVAVIFALRGTVLAKGIEISAVLERGANKDVIVYPLKKNHRFYKKI